jgi:hypothetical protein
VIAGKSKKLIRTKPPKSIKEKLSLLGELIRLAGNTAQDCKRRRLSGNDFTRT